MKSRCNIHSKQGRVEPATEVRVERRAGAEERADRQHPEEERARADRHEELLQRHHAQQPRHDLHAQGGDQDEGGPPREERAAPQLGAAGVREEIKLILCYTLQWVFYDVKLIRIGSRI